MGFNAELDELTDWYRQLLAPTSGRLARISAPTADSLTGEIVVVGQVFGVLEGNGDQKLWRLDRTSSRLRPLTVGSGEDLDPVASPVGGQVAFRSRARSNDGYGACIIDIATGEVVACPTLPGSVEVVRWTADGSSLLLIVADPGVSSPSTQGARITQVPNGAAPDWSPSIDDGSSPVRRLWRWDPTTDHVGRVPLTPNVWDVCAAGDGRAIILASESPLEDDWYRADLRLVDLESGEAQLLYRPKRQLGAFACGADGKTLAFVEGLASDRGAHVGYLSVMALTGSVVRAVDTQEIQIAALSWCGAELVAAGIQRNDTVFLSIDLQLATARILQRIKEASAVLAHPHSTAGPGETPCIVAVVQSITEPGRLVEICAGRIETLSTIATADTDKAIALYGAARLQPVQWVASDGLEIDGLLHLPDGDGPFPLVMVVHGGPTARWSPRSIVEMGLGAALSRCGIAEFYPNPRGSTGRGQAYAEAVLHDFGGREAKDLLEGLDMLVERGIGDPKRLGVTGGSHGGFMTAWLITQTDRFAAAVSVVPITDWRCQRLTSNIPLFNDLFVGRANEERCSPVNHVTKVKTPVLLIAGALDRCTPAVHAVMFHEGLRAAGKTSTLVTYPKEGHGIRSLPASIDYIARVVVFLKKHLLRSNDVAGLWKSGT